MNLIARTPHLQTIQRLHRRFRLTFGGTEGREIVSPDKMLRARMHRLSVQTAYHMPDAVLVQHRRRAAAEDAVEIMPSRGGKPRMKIRRGDLRAQHRHIGGAQKMVQAIADLVGREIFRQIEMRHLRHGMHARIGAACAGDGRHLAGKIEDRLLQRRLDGQTRILPLPADRAGAVIFHDQFEACHDSFAPLGTA